MGEGGGRENGGREWIRELGVLFLDPGPGWEQKLGSDIRDPELG